MPSPRVVDAAAGAPLFQGEFTFSMCNRVQKEGETRGALGHILSAALWACELEAQRVTRCVDIFECDAGLARLRFVHPGPEPAAFGWPGVGAAAVPDATAPLVWPASVLECHDERLSGIQGVPGHLFAALSADGAQREIAQRVERFFEGDGVDRTSFDLAA